MEQIDIGKNFDELTLAIERVSPNKKAIQLECCHLSVAIAQKSIVEELNWKFEGGQYVHVSGPNGSGKSTFLGVLSGLIQPSGGTCRGFIEGRDLDPHAELIYIPQYPIIFHGMTVLENLALISRKPLQVIARALGEPNMRNSLSRTLAVFNKYHRTASHLSTGQQRALLFIAASLARAQVILMDEPYAGLPEDIAHECKIEARGWALAGKLVIVAGPVQR